jgi:hypothetical protein
MYKIDAYCLEALLLYIRSQKRKQLTSLTGTYAVRPGPVVVHVRSKARLRERRTCLFI